MQEIQTKAIKTYLENLEYLKDKHKSLYERVTMLSNAIENNEYKERYHLEYIKEDQEFDIYDESTKTYVYNRKPKEFIKDAVKNSNLDKLNSMDLLRPEVYNFQKPFPIDESMNIALKSDAKVYNDIFDYIKIFKKSTAYKNKKFKNLTKFVCVGILLGSHIELILEKLQSILIFLYEHNLEIFRLSLFTTNYSNLAKKRLLIFSIMDEQNELELKLEDFYQYDVDSNFIFKYYCTNYHVNNFFDIALSVITKKNPLAYNYVKMCDGLLKPVCINIAKYHVLNTKKQYDLLKNIPVLFIAAGPSFGKNIDWIKKHQKKYFIVAIGATVVKLIEYGIKPDIIVSGDADEIILNQFPIKIRDSLQDIPFLASSSTYYKVLEIFPIKNVILFEIMCLLKHTSKTIKAYTIGESALRLITILGGNNIYMLGTDMALDQVTGASHIQEHEQVKIQEITDEKKEANYFIKKGEFNINDSSISVKGNLRETVVTTSRMASSINAYNYNINIIKQENPYVKIYNLNDGAYFEGASPLEIKNIEIPSSDKIDINIITELFKYSKIGLDFEDLKLVKKSMVIINLLIDNINKLKKTKIKTYNKFKEERRCIINIIQIDLNKYSNLYADKLFTRYYLTMESYLGFQFNEKLSNEANLIKKVKNVWCDHMIKLAYEYKNNFSVLNIK